MKCCVSTPSKTFSWRLDFEEIVQLSSREVALPPSLPSDILSCKRSIVDHEPLLNIPPSMLHLTAIHIVNSQNMVWEVVRFGSFKTISQELRPWQDRQMDRYKLLSESISVIKNRSNSSPSGYRIRSHKLNTPYSHLFQISKPYLALKQDSSSWLLSSQKMNIEF